MEKELITVKSRMNITSEKMYLKHKQQRAKYYEES